MILHVSRSEAYHHYARKILRCCPNGETSSTLSRCCAFTTMTDVPSKGGVAVTPSIKRNLEYSNSKMSLSSMATTYHHDPKREWKSIIDRSTLVENDIHNVTSHDRESAPQQQHLQQPLSLFEMIQQIPHRIQQRKRFNINAGSIHDPVLQLMNRINEDQVVKEIQPYCYHDPNIPYTRNLISTDDETYTLLALCWSYNTCSPIHNHPGDGCYMRIISGCITEKQYRLSPNNETLHCFATNQYTKHQVAFVNDTIGYHSVGCYDLSDTDENNHKYNDYQNQHVDHTSSSTTTVHNHTIPAISLHLYCPPIRHCKIFQSNPDDEHNNKVHIIDSGPMYHHTEYGRPRT